MSVEEFLQKVAWPGVQPSPLGGGEASAAQEPQKDQQEDIPEAAEPTPPEPFTLEFDPVVVQVQEDVTASEPSPPKPFIFYADPAISPQPEPSAPVSDLPLSQDPSFAPALDMNEHAQDH